MNDPDEVKILTKAKAHAQYLAAAKKRLETAPLDELLQLIRKGSGEIAFFAGEEIKRRVKSAQSFAADLDSEPKCLCPADGHSEICPIHRANSSPR